jgi:FkbM family methyltransferase
MYFPREEAAIALVMASGLYERGTTWIFNKLLKKGMVVVDLGASFGYYTLLASRIVNLEGRVFSFEPDPISYSILSRNVQMNKCINVITVNKAIHNQGGKAKFYICKYHDRSGLYKGYNSVREIIVDTITLDQYFEDKDYKIDLIKMDIEGAEMSALEGMTQILINNRNLKIITEFYPLALEKAGCPPVEFLKTLTSYGFRLYRINEEDCSITHADINDLVNETETGKLRFTNLLCIRGFKHGK